MTVADLIAAASRGARRLHEDRRGNVLMLTAFALLPITFATGMGIDYSRAKRTESKLDAVADAASLAAVTQVTMEKPVGAACAAARNTFVSQTGGLDGLSLDVSQPSGLQIVITDTYASGTAAPYTCPTNPNANAPGERPLTRKAVVTYGGTSANSFAGVLGVATLAVAGTSTSQTIKAPYMDVYLALDTSQSMGLAASDEDAKRLWTLTYDLNSDVKKNKRGCQFGCHVAGRLADGSWEKYSNEAIANKYGIKMRVDIERIAALDMINTALNSQNKDRFYRFGVYEFGTDMRRIQALTDDLSSVKNTVSKLTLGPNDGNVGYGDTNLAAVMNGMATQIPASGDGTTQADARKFLFIVTDGVQDLCGGSHCMALMDPAKCETLKRDKKVTIGIVYTTYLPVKKFPADEKSTEFAFEYNWLIAPLPPSKIRPRLEECASPGWLLEASDGDGIHAAMLKLFTQATQAPTIIH
ncbi:VWA domain-containing protein [Sphingomonas sp. NY01]|uniref:TadE/TadG family type IV pilus assembly protein n=1 Tax=Sphingomonas sp. NY01 TaxID=2968057 RepID=UPI00315D3E82